MHKLCSLGTRSIWIRTKKSAVDTKKKKIQIRELKLISLLTPVSLWLLHTYMHKHKYACTLSHICSKAHMHNLSAYLKNLKVDLCSNINSIMTKFSFLIKIFDSWLNWCWIRWQSEQVKLERHVLLNLFLFFFFFKQWLWVVVQIVF